ncbi:MAG TPA: superoxide dismutase family protein [Acidimicrobiales bacterium]|nr:superoxide dismutase family protein [Acidimicrobiales bacterium]
MRRLAKYGLVALVPIATAVAALTIVGAEGGTAATAVLRDGTGKNSGVVRLASVKDGAQVVAQVTLPASAAGFHGFHIHAKGVCDPASVDPASGQVVPFFSAGGHLGGGAGGQSHAGHDGDMPSLLVNKDGTATATFRTDRATLAKILDADGSAVVVHAGPDNFANIPTRYSAGGPDAATLNTGDSGARTLCGVLK